MAAVAICANSTDQVISSDITVTAGTPVTISLFSSTTQYLPADARALIQQKSSGGTYNTVTGGELNINSQQMVIDGPGVFRVVKNPAAGSYGVDQS
jgi:hypothetical protein